MQLSKSRVLKIDYYAIGIYITIGLLIFLAYKFEILSQKTINLGLLGLGLIGSLLLYGFYYKRFRYLKINLIWGFISLIQIYIYVISIPNPDFNDAIDGRYLNSLFYLPSMLVIFQTLRLLYKIIFNHEIIINLRMYQPGEIVEERKVKWIDIFISVIGMMCVIYSKDFIKMILEN